MKKRIITAIGILLIVIPALYFGKTLLMALAAVFSIIAGYEISLRANDNWPKWMRLSIPVLFGLAAVCASFNPEFLLACILLMLIYLMLLLIWHKDVHFDEIGIIFLVFIMVQVTVCYIQVLAKMNRWINFFIIIATYVTDSFCLFGGMLFGKHKLNERISPNKTIEGSFSGWLVGFISSLVFGLLVLKNIAKSFIIFGAVTMPIIGQMGDLAFSAIKRYFKIKDYGTIFPGHGGVLDRIDSLLFNVMWAYILATILL